MEEVRVDESGIHDVNTLENGVDAGSCSTSDVLNDARDPASVRSESGAAEGGRDLGGSFWRWGKVWCGGE